MDTKAIQAQCLKYIASVNSVDIGGSDLGISEKQNQIEWNRGFYNGAHWTREEYNAYISKGIQPIKVNRCRPIIKAMKGMFSQNMQELSVEPRKSGNQSVADVLRELVKYSEDKSSPHGSGYIYSQCLQTGMIDKEAFLKVEIDKLRTPSGNLSFSYKSAYDVDVDPCAKEYNINDTARFVIERNWRDKDEIDILYKRKLDSDSVSYGDQADELYSYFTGDSSATYDENTRKYRYPVLEIWWKEKVDGLVVFDSQTGQVRTVTDKKQVSKLKAAAKNSRRYTVQTKPSDILHKTTMLDRSVLDDEVNPFGESITDLPYFRFCPYWHEGEKAGVLDDIIELNRQENISRTQILRDLSQTMDSGWMVGGGTPQKLRELADYGSVDGMVIDKSQYGGDVEKIVPNGVPVGHFTNAEQMERDIKVVSGVDDAFLGYETGAKESGRAIDLKQQQSRVVSDVVFSNFNATLTLFGDYVVNLILNVGIFTREEVRNIVSESTLIDEKMLEQAYRELTAKVGATLPQPQMPTPPNPQMLAMVRPEDQQNVQQSIKMGVQGAQMYAEQYPSLLENMKETAKEYAISKMMDELENPDLGEYGVKVTISPSAPTVQMQNMIELMGIQDKYGIIPPKVMLESSSLPNKEQIIDEVLRMQSQQTTGAA